MEKQEIINQIGCLNMVLNTFRDLGDDNSIQIVTKKNT